MPGRFVPSYPTAENYGSVVANAPGQRFGDLVRSIACRAYRDCGLRAIQERIGHQRGWDAVAVVLFHRVTDAIAPDGLTVNTAWFRGFCELMRRRFHVVPMAEMQSV